MSKHTAEPREKRSYWYEFYHEYCPVCGREETIKERRYTMKPKSYNKRHHYSYMNCWCEWGYSND